MGGDAATWRVCQPVTAHSGPGRRDPDTRAPPAMLALSREDLYVDSPEKRTDGPLLVGLAPARSDASLRHVPAAHSPARAPPTAATRPWGGSPLWAAEADAPSPGRRELLAEMCTAHERATVAAERAAAELETEIGALLAEEARVQQQIARASQEKVAAARAAAEKAAAERAAKAAAEAKPSPPPADDAARQQLSAAIAGRRAAALEAAISAAASLPAPAAPELDQARAVLAAVHVDDRLAKAVAAGHVPDLEAALAAAATLPSAAPADAATVRRAQQAHTTLAPAHSALQAALTPVRELAPGATPTADLVGKLRDAVQAAVSAGIEASIVDEARGAIARAESARGGTSSTPSASAPAAGTSAGAPAGARTDVRALQSEWDEAVRAVSRYEKVRLGGPAGIAVRRVASLVGQTARFRYVVWEKAQGISAELAQLRAGGDEAVNAGCASLAAKLIAQGILLVEKNPGMAYALGDLVLAVGAHVPAIWPCVQAPPPPCTPPLAMPAWTISLRGPPHPPPARKTHAHAAHAAPLRRAGALPRCVLLRRAALRAPTRRRVNRAMEGDDLPRGRSRST